MSFQLSAIGHNVHHGPSIQHGATDPALLPAPCPLTCFGYHSLGIYIWTHGEHTLFLKWLAVPHPDIHIACCIEFYQYVIPPWTPELQVEVEASVTEEQGKRFNLCAVWLDIWMGWGRLTYFRQEWEEIRGVLEAVLEDEMADFGREGFKDSRRRIDSTSEGRVYAEGELEPEGGEQKWNW